MIKIVFFMICLLAFFYPVAAYCNDTTIEKSKELLNKERYTDVINLLTTYKPRLEELSAYHRMLARAFKGSKQFNDYLEHLRLAYVYSTEDEKPGLLLERAEAYMSMRYYSEASLLFKMYLKDHSKLEKEPTRDTLRAYIGLAEALYNLGNYDDSVRYFSKAGNEITALYGIAKSLQAQGRINEADEAFKRAIQVDRDFLQRPNKSRTKGDLSIEEILYRLSENQVMLKRYGEARKYLNMIKDNRFKAKKDLLSGIIASAENRHNEALGYLNSAFSTGDRDTKRRALYHIAEIYMKTNNNKEAEKKLIELRLNYPYGRTYDDSLLKLARLYRESGETNKAIPLLKELLFRRSPDRRAIDEFESIILNAIETDKEGLLKLWNSVGHWLLEPSRSDTLLKVAQSLSASGTPFIRLAKWIIKNGDAKAKQQAMMLLSGFFVDYGDPVKAGEYLRLVKNTKNDDFYRIKARLSLLNKDIKGAVRSILSIRYPKQEDISLILESLEILESKDKGSRDFQRLVNRCRGIIEGASIRDLVRFADLLFNHGERDEALTFYRKAIEENKERESNQTEIDWAAFRISSITKDRNIISKIQDERLKKLGGFDLKAEEIKKIAREVL